MTAEALALSPSLENYLEAILLLIREQAVARSKDIATRLKVTRASVTGALRALGERGLVNYEPYGFVTLTEIGEKAASRVLRRHEALRDFFVNVLAIDKEEADEVACRMEHGISKHVVDRLIDFAEFVETCPRAGSKWIRGFAYQCKDASKTPGDCAVCIQACLNDIKTKTEKEDKNTMNVTWKIKPGEKAVIERISGAGAVKRRIRDME